MLDETPAVFGRQRSIQRRDDPGRQRPIEAERIANRKRVLPHAQIGAAAERQRLRQGGELYFQHGQVVGGADADKRGIQVTAVAQSHASGRRTGDDVPVGDNVSVRIPDETRPGAARHVEHVARPAIHDLRLRADIDDRRARLLEQVDGRLLTWQQRPSRRHRP